MRATIPGSSFPIEILLRFRLFSVPEYHRLIEMGVLTEADDIELLGGYLVNKHIRTPLHDGTVNRLSKQVLAQLPNAWDLRCKCAITLERSEPEPDLVIVRKREDEYQWKHPTKPEIGFIVEVADVSLDSDRADRCRIYSDAAIPIYWIVNLVDQRIEVYTQPSGPTEAPSYAQRQDYVSGQSVPIVLDGVEVAQLPVAQILG